MEQQIQPVGTVSVTEWVEDRRRTERVAVSLPVHISSNGEVGKFEEISTTLNASRDGVYFASTIPSYKPGMAVVVTFPYSIATERNVQFFGKVVRIDTFSDGRFGIAIELLVTIVNKQKRRPVFGATHQTLG